MRTSSSGYNSTLRWWILKRVQDDSLCCYKQKSSRMAAFLAHRKRRLLPFVLLVLILFPDHLSLFSSTLRQLLNHFSIKLGHFFLTARFFYLGYQLLFL